MATKASVTNFSEDNLYNASWLAVAETDVGSAITIPNKVAELSVQATGTFAGTASVTLQGSMDGTNWATMDDVSNTPIVITASTKIWRFANSAKFIRAAGSAGTAASMNVFIHGKGR